MGLNSCTNILNGSEHGFTPFYHNHHAHNTGNLCQCNFHTGEEEREGVREGGRGGGRQAGKERWKFLW